MAAPGLHINQLPDDLLLRILGDVLREADRTARWDIGCAATVAAAASSCASGSNRAGEPFPLS